LIGELEGRGKKRREGEKEKKKTAYFNWCLKL